MKKNNIIDIWEKNLPCINGWLSIPNSFTAEAFGKMGWDSITIDMQHGQNDYQTSIASLQALSKYNEIYWIVGGLPKYKDSFNLMNYLAIETSTNICSVALFLNNQMISFIKCLITYFNEIVVIE